MTAPAIPTPGDLARRTPTHRPTPTPRPGAAAFQPLAAEDLPAAADMARPGQLRPDEKLRPSLQQGIRLSRMRPESRLLALTLLGYVNFRTGLMLKHEPTPAELAAATGLTEGQVLVQLVVLTQRGWLTRRHPTIGPRKGQLVYQLCVPQLVLQQLRARRAPQTA
ncbi:hypothetical protein [Streptomyces sp. NPDC048242]|uniref:hypothetical protein n=1 Tax=Streptomyces sp. NPDC048242 TaxID=3155026 RepID=UPI0034417871